MQISFIIFSFLTEEPGGLQSTGSQRVGHNWATNTRGVLHYLTLLSGLLWWLSGKESSCQCRRHRLDPWVRKIPWWRKRQLTPAFLSGKSHGQRSLMGYSPRDHRSSTQLGESTATTNMDILFICAFGNVGDFTEGLRRRQMIILEMWPQVECYHLHFFFFHLAKGHAGS